MPSRKQIDFYHKIAMDASHPSLHAWDSIQGRDWSFLPSPTRVCFHAPATELAEGEGERRTRSGVAVDEETGGRSSGRRLSARMEHRRDFGLATRTGGRTCWRYPGKAVGRAVGGGCRRAEQRDEMRPGETEGYGGGWTKMRAYWSFHVTHCPLTTASTEKLVQGRK